MKLYLTEIQIQHITGPVRTGSVDLNTQRLILAP